MQKGTIPKDSPQDTEQTETSETGQTQESGTTEAAPSGGEAEREKTPSQAGETQENAGAESGAAQLAEGGEKKKHHHKLDKDDPLYEPKKKLRRTRRLAHKYEDFKNRYEAADAAVRAKLENTLKKDHSELAENYGYCAQLKVEAKEDGGNGGKKQELAEQILDLTRTAMGNVSKSQNTMADLSLSSQILPLYDDADTALENVRRDKEKFATVVGYAELGRFLKGLKAKREALPQARGLAGASEKMQLLDAALTGLSEQYDSLRSEMGPQKAARADKLMEKKSKLQAKKDELNSKYNEKSPIVRLIRHAMKVHKISGEAEKEPEDKVDFIDEHIMGSAMDLGDNISQMATKDDDTSITGLMGGGAAKAAGKALEGKISLEQAEKIDSGCSAVFSFLQPLWKCFIALRNIKSYIKESKDLSPDEKENKQIDIAGSTFEAISSLAEPILSVAGAAAAVPIIGPLLGFAGNAFSAITQIIKWDKSDTHRKAALAEKDKTKDKMVQKRRKYRSDQDLKSEGLLSAVSQKGVIKKGRLEITSHIEKSTSKGRKRSASGTVLPKTIEQEEGELNTAVGGTSTEDMYKRMAQLKAKKMESEEGLTADEKKEYYKMKALKLERDYKEEKERAYVNKKRRDQGTVELVHVALDVAKNIAGLCPGLGSLIGQVIGVINTGSKYLHKAGTSLKQKGRDKGWWGDGSKTTQAKGEKRSAMAENMYGQMLFVGDHMKKNPEEEPKGTFSDLDNGSGAQVGDRMEHLDQATKTLSFPFSQMYKTPNRESLLDKMASAFSTQG